MSSPSPTGYTESSPPRLRAIRTYGRSRARQSSPYYPGSSSSSWPNLSSSPLPSSFLVTPPSSPSRPAKRARIEPLIRGPLDENEDNEEPIISESTKENLPSSSKSTQAGKQGTLKGFFAAIPRSKPKLPLQPAMTIPSPTPIIKSSSSIPKSTKATSSTNLQQTQLMHLPLLQSCKACGMTYVRGGEDEGVHSRHHGRVMRGIPWEGLGRTSGKGGNKGEKGWKEVGEVNFGQGVNAGKGRIVVCDGSWGGPKLEDILQTVDLSLSSPALPPAILDRCRIFLLLTSSPPPPKTSISGKLQRPDKHIPPKSGRSANVERIVSVVVSQGIKWAMRVIGSDEVKPEDIGNSVVDSGGGVMCDPESLETPLGIHRLYTIPSYRSLGLAHSLLESARDHTVYGCTFDPTKGEVAFSQPTESGRAVMERWGGGKVRVFVDDESQI